MVSWSILRQGETSVLSPDHRTPTPPHLPLLLRVLRSLDSLGYCLRGGYVDDDGLLVVQLLKSGGVYRREGVLVLSFEERFRLRGEGVLMRQSQFFLSSASQKIFHRKSLLIGCFGFGFGSHFEREIWKHARISPK